MARKVVDVELTQNDRVTPAQRHTFSNLTDVNWRWYAPQKHFADETVLVDWLFVLTLWCLCPHLKCKPLRVRNEKKKMRKRVYYYLFYVFQYLWDDKIQFSKNQAEVQLASSPYCCAYQTPWLWQEVSCCSAEKSRFECDSWPIAAKPTEVLGWSRAPRVVAAEPRRAPTWACWRTDWIQYAQKISIQIFMPTQERACLISNRRWNGG